MPLSSRRDMSVSISPWCLWRSAHRGGAAEEEIEGCAISLSSIAYPRLFTLSHPSSNLREKVWRMCNQDGRGGMWTCLQRNKGMVDRQRIQPSSTTFCWAPPTPSSTCTCQRCSGWDLQGSLVLSACCSHNISLSSAPVALKIEPKRRNRVCYTMPTFSVFSKAQHGSFYIV